MGSSNICFQLLNLFVGNHSNEKQLEAIDTQLKECFQRQTEKQQKLNELKNNLALLSDKTKKMDPNGIPRAAAINMTKNKMVAIIAQIKQFQKLINFYTTMKINLENNQMSNEMATQMQIMKKQMLKTGTIDANKFKDDFDDIMEMNEELQETQHIINDTITNVWEMDMEGVEEELEAYLADDFETEKQVETPTAPKPTSMKRVEASVPTPTPPHPEQIAIHD